jgi:hypothetical protein
MTSSDRSPPPPPSASRAARHRSFLPRFGLRSLLLFAVVFCLLCAWMGRNAYRMRQEQAALEALKRAHAGIYGAEMGSLGNSNELSAYADFPSRLVGLKGPLDIRRVAVGHSAYVQETLSLEDAPMARALSALPAFPSVESLYLEGSGIGDDSLVGLHRLPKLESITLSRTKVTGAGLASLGPPLHVREVEIIGCKDLGPGIGDLTSLRSLKVSESILSRADFQAIASLPELQELRLTRINSLDQDTYAPLAEATSLKLLRMSIAEVRDEDMAAFGKIPTLEFLSVTGISDAGLASLSPSPNLRGIELDVRVTRPAALKFSAERPECIVRHLYRPGGMYYRGGKIVEESDLPPEEVEVWHSR